MRIRYEKRVIKNGLFEYEGNFYTFTGLPDGGGDGVEILVGKNKKGGIIAKYPKDKWKEYRAR